MAVLLYCFTFILNSTMDKRFLELHDMTAYKKAFKLSNDIWKITLQWNYFAKDTVGKQYVRAADSIAANLAEGFGRYTKKDKIHFYRYSYGSIQETIDWTNKAFTRNLITQEQFQSIKEALTTLPKDVHHLIAFTDLKLAI